jgi:hypothetical protein
MKRGMFGCVSVDQRERKRIDPLRESTHSAITQREVQRDCLKIATRLDARTELPS